MRLFRPSLAVVVPDAAQDDAPLYEAFAQLERAMDRWCEEAKSADSCYELGCSASPVRRSQTARSQIWWVISTTL